MIQEPELGQKIYDRRLARRLVRYLRPYRLAVVASVFLLLLVSAARLVGPYLTKVAIDEAIAHSDRQQLEQISILFLAILAGQLVFTFLQMYLMNWTGQKIMYDLRIEIFQHLQELDLKFFNRNPTGRIITRITNDVDVLNELFTSGVVSIFGDIFSLSGIVLVMLWLNWKLALVSFAVIPLLFVASWIFKQRVRRSYRRVRLALAAINAFLQENITGMSIVQLFVQQKRKFGDFVELNRTHRDANLDSIFYYAIFYPLVNLIGALAIGLILWYGGLQVFAGALTLGSVVAFIQYSERFYRPISDLSEKFNILQSAMAASERIFGLLDTRSSILLPAHPRRLARIRGQIDFENVNFEYVEGTPVLKDINLSIRAGEKVALVGATGSGKSTLVNLLCRFHDVERGEVKMDGINVRDFDLDQLRQAIAVVLQDVFLFSGSVEENIGLWGRRLQQDRIETAARQVHADHFIERLAHGYQTPVLERGASLSSGERQLLAFARALAHDPKILVLDEATSSVDTDTEILIQDALQTLLQGRTAVVVAHRLSTIQHCDRIVVLHQGRLREQGTHEELLSQRGIYHRLFQLQYKEQLAIGDWRPAIGGLREGSKAE